MKHITHVMAVEAINSIGLDEFDNHDIEQRMLRLNAAAVAEELLDIAKKQKKPDAVWHEFSRQFGAWIGKEFRGDIRKNPRKKVTTPNLGGRRSENQRWEKLNPGVPIV